MKLFLDNLNERTQEFRKEAGYTHRLSEVPENWGQEIGSELHKQLPFLSDYEVNVTLDKQDPGRGFAFGYADISNRTERPEVEHEEAGIPHLRIPVVAEERQVRPFSVFMDGERVLPMTEDRFREALFNPATFDLSNSVPRDPSLVEPLMPPQRSGIGLGGEYKMASVTTSESAAPKADDVLPFSVQKYKNHPDLLKKAIEIEKGFLELDKKTPKPRLSIKPPSDKQKSLNNGRDALHLKRRELDLELASRSVKEKVSFKHISKDQWSAIYHSEPIQKLVLKHGKYEHPEITNAVYEMATKHYGFHPKLYPISEQTKGLEMQRNAMKSQKDMAKIQREMQKHHEAMGKMNGGTKTASLLQAIAPTIRESDRDHFVEKIASDSTIRAGLKKSGLAEILVEVMDTKLASAADRLLTLADSIEPSVVTFQKLPGGDFMVKSANVNVFAGGTQAAGQVVPFAEVAEAVGDDVAKSMQPGQVVTAVSDPIEISEGETEGPSTVSSFGEYKVQDADGKEMKGWVFPNVLSWDSDFTPQPVSMFTNGASYALQEGVAGELVNKESKPPTDIPKGEGVFWGPSSGGAAATAPITIEYGTTGGNGVSKYVGSDVFGNKLTVSVVPDIKKPEMLSESEFAIPKSWNFMRLNKKVALSEDTDSFGLGKKVSKEKTSATLFYNGAYNIIGGCGLDKISSDLRQDLDVLGAEFILGLLGVDGVTAKQKVAEARRKGAIKIAGLKTIRLLSDHYRESVKTASAFLSKLPNLRRDLIKEAASIDDPGTVDKVLALNFINPENLSTFVDYLPELEQASEQMAEMVLAGYLGMKEIPLGAVERSMHNMEEVISGLKAIQHAQG